MSDARTVLLTGGTGFLGSHLLERLVRDHREVVLLKRSTSDTGRIRGFLQNITTYDIDTDPLEKAFSENQIDVIIHCATEQGKKQTNPLFLLEANVLFPLRLLQFGWERNVFCFINTDTILDNRLNAYALSKHHFCMWLKTFENRMTCVNVSLELVYGPGDAESKFVTYMVRELLRNADHIDLTRGEQKRDFIYIEDVIDAFMRIIGRSRSLPKGFFPYEVGTGTAFPIRDIVTMMKSLAGNSRTVLNFGALPYREHEVMESHVDLAAIRELGWQPRYSLEEGLRSTIDAERTRLKIGT